MLKRISRTVWLISLISLCNDFSSEMLYPIIPLYLKQIGYGSLLIGVLEGVAEFLGGMFKIYFGSLSDRFRSRLPFVQIGYSLSVISRPLMAIFPNAFAILSARILDKTGKGLRTGARDALLGDESSKENRAEIFGFHRSMDTFGAVLGPLTALIFLYFYPEHYKSIFLISIIPGVLAIFFTLLLKEKKQTEIANTTKFKNHFTYWYKANKKYKLFILLLLFFAIAGSSDLYLLLRTKELGYSDAQVLSLYVFFNLIFALAAFPIGALADKYGKRNFFFIGILLYTLSYFFIGFGSQLLFLIIGFFCYGLYYAFSEGIAKSIIVNLIDKDEKASALGFYGGMQSIILLFANLLAGFMWVKFGAQTVFIYTIVIGIVSSIIFVSLKKKLG